MPHGDKFARFTAYLKQQHEEGNDRITLSFSDIERVLGFPLSKTARKYYWGNDRTQSFPCSWLAADYVVASGGCNLVTETTVFEYNPKKVAALYAGAYRTPENTAPRSPSARRKTKRDDISDPCAAEVEKYLLRWQEQDNYRLQESALNKLYCELCPRNDTIEDVLLKCSTLNDFYATNIFSIYPVANHILSLNIDDRLQHGDLTLVDDIAESSTGRRHYSFASKYCSHHQPLLYPIYDSYVDTVLCYFRDVDGFAAFRSEELKTYPRFLDVLHAFCAFYNLETYSLKQIDQYIWQLGKEYFPKNYYTGKAKPESNN